MSKPQPESISLHVEWPMNERESLQTIFGIVLRWETRHYSFFFSKICYKRFTRDGRNKRLNFFLNVQEGLLSLEVLSKKTIVQCLKGKVNTKWPSLLKRCLKKFIFFCWTQRRLRMMEKTTIHFHSIVFLILLLWMSMTIFFSILQTPCVLICVQ